MIVIQEEEAGFSAFATVDDKFIAAMGDNFDDFLDNLLEAVNLSFEDDGIRYSLDEIGLISSQEEGVSLMDAYKKFTSTKA